MRDDWFALTAAACWAVGSMLSVTPARHLGAFAFTRWRMLIVAVVLGAATFLVQGFDSVTPAHATTMAVSGLIGIFVGDTALFGAMNRLGPRRTGVLFATNALLSAFLGALVFGERMSLQALCGAALTIGGVMIAVAFGQHRTQPHAWEQNRGHVGAGIALALLAAFAQSVGTLVAKPAMADALDPFAAATIRTSVACAAHFVVLWLGLGAARAAAPLTPRIALQMGASGIVGIAIGVTALLLALESGDVGMVAVLSSVTPVLVLPLLWLLLGRAPARGAWLGAALTVAGTALILAR